MAKAEIIRRWNEVADGAMHDSPPRTRDGKHHYWIFVNRCEVQRKAGVTRLVRVNDVKEFTGNSMDDVEQQVVSFCDQPGVRMLRDDLNANDWDELPLRSEAPADVIDGTADIYKRKSDEV